MSSEWREFLFHELCDITRGASPRPIHDYLSDEGMPWIKIADATSEPSRFIQLTKEKIKLEGVPASVEVFPGDLILSNSATPGLPKFLKINACIHDGWMLLRNFKHIDKEFAYWLLLMERTTLVAQGNGSVFTNLKTDILKNHPVTIPPIEIQRLITLTLNAIDDRITLLRETNATLESIAQALFKSWFVDFDPVRAKLEGREPEGMDAETAALFPDDFEESELGLVPRGWRVGMLADLATLNPESWTVKTSPKSIKYIDLSNAKVNEINEITEYSFNEAPSRARRVLRNGDSIIGTVRPGNRSFAYIYQAPDNLTGSTGFAVLRPKISSNAEFLFIAATQDSSIEYLAHVADGGAYPAIRAEVVTNIKTVLPSEIVMGEFHKAVSPIFAKMGENKIQVQTLTALRDILLPRLISGQLRLREIESQFNNEVFT